MYTVSAASRMSGVHPDTLRAWERRYEAVHPRRDERGRRMYAAEDVERLRLLRCATERGHSISRLANLSLDELRAVGEGGHDVPANGPGETGRRDMNRMVARLIDAVRRYRADECDEILGLAATLLDCETLIDDVLTPALTLVGELWHRGEMGVAQERMLSASARRTLSSLISTYRRRANGPALLLATLPGEHHEVGLMAAALRAATAGMDCIYLGPDIPCADLVAALEATGARCLGVSCVVDPESNGTLGAIRDLCERMPPDRELWLGGCGVAALDAASLPARCLRLDGHGALTARARALASG